MTLALDNYRSAQVQHIEVAGLRVAYRSFGGGPTVVFLHGWPLSGVTYRALIHALQPHYRCLVPDLPGAGDTPWSPQISESMAGYAKVVRAFADALQLDRFAFIAHDSGGTVARMVAADLGARVNCLILQNTEVSNYMPPVVRALQLTAQTKYAPAVFSRLLASARYRKSKFGFGECFGDLDLIEGEFLDACLEPLRKDPAGHLAMLAKFDLDGTKHLPDLHRRISAPMHLFWGGADTFFPLSRARAMMSEFQQRGELEIVSHAKLYVHEEAAEPLARFSLPRLQAAFAAPAVQPVAGRGGAHLES